MVIAPCPDHPLLPCALFPWPLQSRWHFQDYAAEDLLHIMRSAAKRRYDWDLKEEVLLAGVKVGEGRGRWVEGSRWGGKEGRCW